MCIGIPMQVIEPGELSALCRGRNGEERVNMLLLGEQPAGTWVLSWLGWAREVISEQDAQHINRALDGLGEIMQGAESLDVEHYFPGLESAKAGTDS